MSRTFSHQSYFYNNDYTTNLYGDSPYAWLEEYLEPLEAEARRQEEQLRWKRKLARSPKSPKTLLDRMAMTQREYMNMLAVPRDPDASIAAIMNPQKKNYCFKCGRKPYPVVQLTVPKKLQAFDNWSRFENVLPTEMTRKFDSMWRSGYHNLEPSDVRYYLRQIAMIEENLRRRRRKGKKNRKKKKKKNRNRSHYKKAMSIHQSFY